MVIRAIIIILTLIGGIFVYNTASTYFRGAELTRLAARGELYSTSIANALDRFAYLPEILTDVPIVLDRLMNEPVQVNEWLQSKALETGVEAIYIMDADGLTLAASNFNTPSSFVGQNYGFRPYFKDAMKGENGEFFAIGATTSQPGYFFSAPARRDGKIIGAVAAKVDLSPLVDQWKRGEDIVIVRNRDGVVVLSSDPKLSYRTLHRLSAARREAIAGERQFGKELLLPLEWEASEQNIAKLEGEHFLQVVHPLKRSDWVMHILEPQSVVQQRATISLLLFAALVSALSIIGFFMREARMRSALMASKEEEARLAKFNTRLHEEIDERRAAENALQAAQASLTKASRLAALGELSTTVTHELGQPLSALRNYLTAAELDPKRQDDPLICQIEGVIQRMERTTAQLRNFSRAGARDFERIDLREVINSAYDLVAHDIEAAGATYNFQNENASSPIAYGNAHQLEQVIVNLFRNALAAMRYSENKEITVQITSGEEDQLILSVLDTGEGVEEIDLEKLTEPFYTTRPSGDGMGLGLAISSAILREHEARLSLQNGPLGKGAKFKIEFNAAKHS